jgi:hypothetical protein
MLVLGRGERGEGFYCFCIGMGLAAWHRWVSRVSEASRRQPGLFVGVPLTAALLLVTLAFADIRTARYRAPPSPLDDAQLRCRRSLRSLEAEFAEWEERGRAQALRMDYEMKPVK